MPLWIKRSFIENNTHDSSLHYANIKAKWYTNEIIPVDLSRFWIWVISIHSSLRLPYSKQRSWCYSKWSPLCLGKVSVKWEASHGLRSARSSPLCWVSTSKVDFYIMGIPHELRWILLSITFASSICRIRPHCFSSNCWSLASTAHDHILKQHKIRLNLLILVYPITRGQKERGNQGTGPLQGTKTFCMKTEKSAA